MDKFTLFELHVHDGMEFSAMNTAPAIGRRSSDDDEEFEELEEFINDDSESESESESAESSGRSLAPVKLLMGVVVLAVVAVAIRKFRSSEAELEIAELDDYSEEQYGEEEAEH